jgi:hypothetical protein
MSASCCIIGVKLVKAVNLLVKSTRSWMGQELIGKDEGRHFVFDIVVEIDYRQTIVSNVSSESAAAGKRLIPAAWKLIII